MTDAAWMGRVFAAMYAALALFYLIRFFAAGRASVKRSEDVSRCVMSVGMVAMLVPWIDPLPRLCWQVLFSATAGQAAFQLIRRRVRPAPALGVDEHHELHLMIGGLAMLYTLSASPSGPPSAAAGMAGMGSTSPALPVLAWIFIAYFLMFIVLLSTRLAYYGTALASASAESALGGGGRGVVSSPQLLSSSEIAMAIGMSYMLMTMSL